LTIRDSTITANLADVPGIENTVLALDNVTATVLISGSTINGNVCLDGDEGCVGGLFNDGPATAVVTNSTISENFGWGIWAGGSSILRINDTTLAGNRSE